MVDKSTELSGYISLYRFAHAKVTYNTIKKDETHDVEMSDAFEPLSVILFGIMG